MPDPDLLIRTSGEQRISNFLLWQCAYAELVFTETLWPDFAKSDLEQAIDEYCGRERRYRAGVGAAEPVRPALTPAGFTSAGCAVGSGPGWVGRRRAGRVAAAGRLGVGLAPLPIAAIGSARVAGARRRCRCGDGVGMGTTVPRRARGCTGRGPDGDCAGRRGFGSSRDLGSGYGRICRCRRNRRGRDGLWIARNGAQPEPGWTALGVLWVALPCVSLLWLARQQGCGRATLLWLLAVVWATDIGAYAVGRTFGGPRLAPRLSPRKTWSGFAGGIVCAALAGAATALALGRSAALPVLLSAGLAIVAQFGDLAESLAKRRFGVKDQRAHSRAWRVPRSAGRAARGDPGGGAADLDRRPQRPGMALIRPFGDAGCANFAAAGRAGARAFRRRQRE